jgi:hypothetical protein
MKCKVVGSAKEIETYATFQAVCGVGFESIELDHQDFDNLLNAPEEMRLNWISDLYTRMIPPHVIKP